MRFRSGRQLANCVLLFCLLLPAFSTLPNTLAGPEEPVAPNLSVPAQTTDARQVVIFVQGINTSYDPPIVSPVPQLHDPSNFEVLKDRLIDDLDLEYQSSDFIDFSYAPGAYEGGNISLVPYTCSQTGQDLFQSGASLRKLIENVHAVGPEKEIVLVGHSMGGVVIAWALEGLGTTDAAAQAISSIVTIDSPLYGASSEDINVLARTLVLFPQCQGNLTQSAAARQLQSDLLSHLNAITSGVPSGTELRLLLSFGRFHDAGVRVGTFGNQFDCIYNHPYCANQIVRLGNGPLDNALTGLFGNEDLHWTQVYAQQGTPLGYSRLYSHEEYWVDCEVAESCVSASHNYLLEHPPSEMLDAIGPAAGVDHSQLPEEFVGAWSGQGTQTDPDLTWPIAIELTRGSTGELVGTVNYPPAVCSGDLSLVLVSNSSTVSLYEDITVGEQNCKDGGAFTLTLLDARAMSFRWTHPGFTTVAEGILTRESPTINPVYELPPPASTPNQLSYVHVMSIACPGTPNNSITVTVLPFTTDGPDCVTGPLNFTITDQTGNVGYYNSHDGTFPLELPAGSYTFTELDSGATDMTASFTLPLADTRETKPPECDGYMSCVAIVISLPMANAIEDMPFPSWYLGTWEGVGTQSNPDTTWPITFTFTGGAVGEVVGTVEYPTLDCGGTLIYLERVSQQYAEDSFNFTEDITWGENNCADGGTFFTSHSEGCCTISFTWSAPGTESTAWGTVTPVSGS